MGAATRQVVIRGRVQGVGFRYWTASEAIRLGLHGWVRNRRDGSVEALFSGPEEIVAEMLRRCSQGPGPARIDAIDDQPILENALRLVRPGERFSQLPTV